MLLRYTCRSRPIYFFLSCRDFWGSRHEQWYLHDEKQRSGDRQFLHLASCIAHISHVFTDKLGERSVERKHRGKPQERPNFAPLPEGRGGGAWDTPLTGCDRWIRTPTRNSVPTREWLKQDGKSRIMLRSVPGSICQTRTLRSTGTSKMPPLVEEGGMAMLGVNFLHHRLRDSSLHEWNPSHDRVEKCISGPKIGQPAGD